MQIKILKTELVEWKKLKSIQPQNFKSFTPDQFAKLKTSLKNNGFIAPFYVWEFGKTIYNLDGYHREKAMRELEHEGVKIPAKLPANFIECANKKEAKKCVLIYNAHYARIDNSVMIDWIPDLDRDELNLEIEIPNIEFNLEDYNPKDNEQEYDENIETANECPSCGYQW